MSSFVLNRKYELALPTNYVDVDNGEMEYVDGGNWLTDKAEAVLLSVVSCFIYDAVKPYMIKAAIAASGWVKAAVVSEVGWVVANPGVAIGILAGVAGFTAGWIACRYHLRKK